MIRPFSKIQSQGTVSSDVFNRQMDNVSNTLNPIAGLPQLQSTILTKVSLSTGTNIVPTGLGRPLQGWQIIRLRASAIIYDLQDSSTSPNTTLTLVSSAPVVVDLLVF